MGVMDNLMFWKKKDDFSSLDPGLSSPPDFNSNNLGMPQQQGMPNNLGMPDQNMALPSMDQGVQPQNQGIPNDFNNPPQSFNELNSRPMHETAPQGFQSTPVMPPQQSNQQSNDNEMLRRDIELLSYKLDTIKAALDMINQRVSNIERLAMNEVQHKKGW